MSKGRKVDGALFRLGVARIRAGEITREMVMHNLGVTERALHSRVETFRQWRRGNYPKAPERRREIREGVREDVRFIRCARRVLDATGGL